MYIDQCLSLHSHCNKLNFNIFLKWLIIAHGNVSASFIIPHAIPWTDFSCDKTKAKEKCSSFKVTLRATSSRQQKLGDQCSGTSTTLLLTFLCYRITTPIIDESLHCSFTKILAVVIEDRDFIPLSKIRTSCFLIQFKSSKRF